MNQNSGLGSVILKNIQIETYQASDALIAIKHGNGRDWWVITRRWDSINDEFYEYLVTPVGVSTAFIQHAGTPTGHGFYFTSFSKSGNKFIGMNPNGLMELFDFDRCTGNFSLNQTISQEATMSPYPYYWGGSFSPNEKYLYVSASGVSHPTYLIQYDLTAPVISLTADTLWSYSATDEAGGHLRLAPDGKIYWACEYYDGNIDYPFADTTFNMVNNNLSVINYPDSPGVACGFAPFSFNLGAGRCYWGLPNNPDYELGAMVNSTCDTVTGVGSQEFGVRSEELHVFYHPGWQIAFINAEGLKGKNYSLSVFDLMGREVYHEQAKLSSQYFTKDLRCEEFASGMYIVTLQTDKEKLVKRFVKE